MPVGNIFDPESLFWGFLSITGISALSLTGLFFLPIIKGKWRSRWMQVFIALAVSTMSSDALLHILPQVTHPLLRTNRPHPYHQEDEHRSDKVLGVHSHDHHHHQHHHDHENSADSNHNHSDHQHHDHSHHHHHQELGVDNELDAHSMLLKMTAVIGAVYILYLLEFISAAPIWSKNDKILDCSNNEKAPNIAQDGWYEPETASDDQLKKVGGIADEPIVMFGLRSAAFTIIFGDAIHNFIDGIAVGASFVISKQVGFATTLAVACHELPHELGDFAVLIESGLTIPRAMFLNVLSALTAYIGLFVGLAAISVNSAVELLLAVTAGMFLYVAWLDMLVHLKMEAASKGDKWYITLLLQNIGFILGFMIMFAIGWYEKALASL